MHEREIDPLDLGVPRCDPAELRGGSPEENAQVIREVFAGRDGAARDAILLNAAGAIAAGGHARDLGEGLELARRLRQAPPASGSKRSQPSPGARRDPFPRRAGGAGPAGDRRGEAALALGGRPATVDADPAVLAPAFALAGAAACSILVDERFGGTFDDLRAARAATRLPLLAKGFFTEEAQLRICREGGADAALLLLETSTTIAPRRCSLRPPSSGSRRWSRRTTRRSSNAQSRSARR